MNGKVGLIKVKALVNTTLSTAKHWKSVRKYMATLLSRLTSPFCLWLAVLAFVYSLVTIE